MSLETLTQERDRQERYVNEGIIVGKNALLFGKIQTYNVRVLYGNEKVVGYATQNSEVLIQVPIQEVKDGFAAVELEEGQKVVLGYLNNDLNSPYIINNGVCAVETGTPANDGDADDPGDTPVVITAQATGDGTVTVTLNGKQESRAVCINTQYVFNQLYSAGFTCAAACGVLGNIVTESSFNPTADNGNHHGIAQWGYGSGGGRWDNAKKWMQQKGYSADQYDTIEAQTAFLIYDLIGNDSGYNGEPTWVSYVRINLDTTPRTHLTSVPDSVENAVKVSDQIRLWFERCNEQGMAKRQQYAAAYYMYFQPLVFIGPPEPFGPPEL